MIKELHFLPSRSACPKRMFGFYYVWNCTYYQTRSLLPTSVSKKALATGLVSQYVLLPALTILLIIIWSPPQGIALGMILVAACPGGNVSNFFSLMARGNVALSVTLTAITSVSAFLITPLSFLFWSSLSCRA
ncbi:MAG: bile acid:sodium symporter [Cytophagales bacterium]|nr:bile acid:sodium symporter [Cytophagales bacterium]